MTQKPPNLKSCNKEEFRLYYQHQYERIKELEHQRLTITNVIVSISVLSFSLAFADIDKLNLVNAVGLPIAVVIANLIAIFWNWRSKTFIKIHQKRAHAALNAIAPEVVALNIKIPKPDNADKDPFSRFALQTYLHVLLMVLSILPILLYFKILV